MAKGDKKKRVEKSASFYNASADSCISVPHIIDAGLGQETELITAAVSSQHQLTEKELEKSPKEFHETPHLSSIIVQRYEGEKYKDQFHGEGVVYFQGGHVYKGMFSEGVMQGHGIYIWADGTKYEGEFTANVPSGHGTYTWTDGSCYKGEVSHGIRNGIGTFRFADASAAYRGQWHQGKKHGKGTIYYNKDETSWYDGDWVKNIREGWGTRCYLSGNVYEGEWRNNQRHGEGRMTWQELGQQYSGTWKNGVQHGQGTHTWFLKRVSGSQYPLRNQYRGQFVQGLRHGQGSFYYASGALYTGEWKNNMKHGPGKFIFKNGRVFEGEFVDDHMEEFPSFCLDGSKSPDLSGIRTHTPRLEDGVSPRKTSLRDTATLGPDMVLDIDTLLENIPESQRDAERKQVEFAVLRHIAELRSIYSFYSSLGHGQSPDNTFLLSRLQFWRLLKDCGVHLHGVTLAQVDRFVSVVLCTSEDVSPLEIHSPFSTMLLRRFLSCVVILAYHTYHKEIHTESSNNVLVACFTKLMTDNLIPHAKHVKGPLFSIRVHGVVAVNYIDRCWEIYQAFCHPNPAPLRDLTMTCRQFVWMCKDLVLVDAHLTARKLLEILFAENGATRKLPSNNLNLEVNFADNDSARELSSNNLNLEMTFLEFFEALLGCAEVKGRMAGQTNRESPAEPSPRAQVPNVSRRVSPVEDSRESPQLHSWHAALMPAATAKSSNHNLSSDMSSFKSVEIGKSKNHLQMSSSEDMETRHSARSVANLKSPTGAMDSRSGDTVERHEEDSVAVATASPVSMLEAKLSNQTLCPPSTEPIEERGAEGKPVGPEASMEGELDLWIQRTHKFFTETFFPAFEYSLLLRKEMEDERLRGEATSRIALAKAKEKARLREQWEAEERERRREEEDEEEADKVEVHEEESTITPVTQTPVASTTSVVAAAKQPHASAAKKKKK